MTNLQVGYAQSVITPRLDRPVYLAGFGQNRRAESVHDDLYVRALALQRGEVRAVVAMLDLIGLERTHCWEIESEIIAQVGDTCLFLACTHTHHGPDTIGLWGPDMTTSGVDEDYLAGLKERVVETALKARTGIQPATLRVAAVQVTGLAKNARDPDILDQELTILQFCDAKTAVPLVTWLIYPCHPEVLWDQNPHITSDYVGPLRRTVEAGTHAPCLAGVGAIGGMMTPDVTDHSFAEAEAMGRALAKATLEALEEAPIRPVAYLEHARHLTRIPMANPLFRMAMEAGLLPNRLGADGAVATAVDLLKLGSTWLLGVPGELFPALGLAFKAQMREAGAQIAGIVGLTNDELGYILPQEVFVYPENPFEPEDHYEETMSVGPEMGPRVQAALGKLLAARKR